MQARGDCYKPDRGIEMFYVWDIEGCISNKKKSQGLQDRNATDQALVPKPARPRKQGHWEGLFPHIADNQQENFFYRYQTE